MILDRVTVTGADASVRPEDLLPLSRRFPFVEWGILLSHSQEGSKRFPPLHWIESFFEIHGGGPYSISGHLCGAWVHNFCRGGNAFAIERPTIARRFDRLQLNFHAFAHEVDAPAFAVALKNLEPAQGYILQFDDVNNALLSAARMGGVHTAPLFDVSGGAGVLPAQWPTATEEYCGYAGGLSPENLDEQLHRIVEAAPRSRIWIDVETRVRSADDRLFDLGKVEHFLTVARPWVTG